MASGAVPRADTTPVGVIKEQPLDASPQIPVQYFNAACDLVRAVKVPSKFSR